MSDIKTIIIDGPESANTVNVILSAERGLTGPQGPEGPAGPDQSFTATASGSISAGDYVNLFAGGARKADGASGYRADAFSKLAYTNGQTATLYPVGAINDAVTGRTPGARQWLSNATPGLSTETPPTGLGELVQSLGFAISATEVEFVPNQPILLAGQPLPVNTVLPVISGANLIVGTTLSTTNGTWTNTPSAYTYQWMRSGVEIGGATASIYVLAVADIGSTITCRVVASNASGSGVYAESNSLGPVLIAVPVNSVAPVVTSPSLTVGVTATTTTGTWSNSPTGYTYQWYRGGSTLITGETSNTYVLATADIGVNITCKVIASNTTGAGAEVTSNSIGPVVAVSALVTAIAITRLTGPAPFAVNVDAINTTTPLTTRPFDECAFDWDFGETGLGNWAYGAQAGTLSKNLEQGPLAGHIYETPGTYTITLTATDGTNTDTDTVQVTVTDPDTVYSGTNTVCIANGTLPVAGVNGVPTGALCYNETTWAGVCSRMTAGKRILLKKGDSWTCVDLRGPSTASSATPTQIGAYGTGANPIVNNATNNNTCFFMNNPQSRIDVRDIKFVGTELTNCYGVNGSTNYGFSALRIESYLMGSALTLGTGSVGNEYGDFVVQDCNFHENFSEVVIYTPGVDTRGGGKLGIWMNNSERVSIIGNRIYNMRGIEHNIRTQGVGKALYAHNLLDSPGTGKHAMAIRGKVAPDAPRTTRYIRVADNLITTDNNPNIDRLTQFGPQAAQYLENIEDVIIEGNWFNAKYGTGVHSEISGKFTLRNNLFKNSMPTGYASEFTNNYTNTGGTGVPSDTRVYNNSAVAVITGTGYQFSRVYASLASLCSGVLVKNNLIYASGQTGTPVILTLDGGNPNTGGGASNNSTPTQVKSVSPAFVANPPVLVTDWKLTGASYGLTGGATIPVLRDFFNSTKDADALGACNQ